MRCACVSVIGFGGGFVEGDEVALDVLVRRNAEAWSDSLSLLKEFYSFHYKFHYARVYKNLQMSKESNMSTSY